METLGRAHHDLVPKLANRRNSIVARDRFGGTGTCS